jgi:hypothetical protein
MQQTARIIVLIVILLGAMLCPMRVTVAQSNRVPGEPMNLGQLQQPDELDDSTSSSAPNNGQQSSASTNHPMFLQAGVSHSEHLAPVEGMNVGTEFNQTKALQSTAPKRIWFRVPPWLAGSWAEDDYTQTSYSNYQTGANSSSLQTHHAQTTERWGLQRDNAGGVWDVINLPHISTTASDKWVWKDLHTDDSTVFDSAIKLISRMVATRTVINKATGLIYKVHQMECFDTYSMAGMDMIRTDYSMKTFDQQGNPINLRSGFRVGHKTAPFQVNNFLNGEDVRPSFRQYLIDHGKADLVPTE